MNRWSIYKEKKLKLHEFGLTFSLPILPFIQTILSFNNIILNFNQKILNPIKNRKFPSTIGTILSILYMKVIEILG